MERKSNVCSKVFLVLLLVLSSMLVSSNVFADMGAPVMVEDSYKARVNNPDGTDVFEWQWGEKVMSLTGRLNYGDEVKVYSYSPIDEQYVYMVKDNNADVRGYILEGDLQKVDWQLSDFTYSETETSLLVVSNEGVKIFELPLYAEDNAIGSIPYGTKFSGREIDQADGWYYVTYNGISGFVCSVRREIAYKSNSEVIAINSIRRNSSKNGI